MYDCSFVWFRKRADDDETRVLLVPQGKSQKTGGARTGQDSNELFRTKR